MFHDTVDLVLHITDVLVQLRNLVDQVLVLDINSTIKSDNFILRAALGVDNCCLDRSLLLSDLTFKASTVCLLSLVQNYRLLSVERLQHGLVCFTRVGYQESVHFVGHAVSVSECFELILRF